MRQQAPLEAQLVYAQIDAALQSGTMRLGDTQPCASRELAIQAAQTLNWARKTAQGAQAQQSSHAPGMPEPVQWYAKAVRLSDLAYANALAAGEPGDYGIQILPLALLGQRAGRSSKAGRAFSQFNIPDATTSPLAAIPQAAEQTHADTTLASADPLDQFLKDQGYA